MADEIQSTKLYPLLSTGKITPVKQRNAATQQRRFSRDLQEEEEQGRGEGREEENNSVRIEIGQEAKDRGEHLQDDRAAPADGAQAEHGRKIDILV